MPEHWLIAKTSTWVPITLQCNLSAAVVHIAVIALIKDYAAN